MDHQRKDQQKDDFRRAEQLRTQLLVHGVGNGIDVAMKSAAARLGPVDWIASVPSRWVW